MSSKTTTTTTAAIQLPAAPATFDACIEQLAEAMNQSYFFDENGAPVNMDDEQKEGVEKTVETVKNVAIETLGPLFTSLSQQIVEQGKRIDALRANVGKGAITAAAVAGAFAVQEEGQDGLPTAEWLIANRKSKSGKDVTGYNCFTMWFMAKNKSGFPPKGSWDQQNKAAWNALAKQVNGGSGATAIATNAGANANAGAGASIVGKAAAAPIALPETKGKGTKLTAYNMYTIDFMAKNPGAGFPPKGSWAKVPKSEVARYQAQADALKAQRA